MAEHGSNDPDARALPRERLAVGAGLAAVVALPLTIALTDVHLAPGPAALLISTAAGALAVSALALQPLLALRPRALGARPVHWHRVLGVTALVLVLVHVGALFVLSGEDTLFAMSPDGPTRARMALIATLALLGAVVLGLGRERLPLADGTWRVLHGYVAVLVIVLGIGHAVLTDGALDGAGTVVLVALAVAGVLAAAGAHVRWRGGIRRSPAPDGRAR